MLSHFACVSVHVVGLWGLCRRGSPVVEVLTVSKVELRPAGWIVSVSVEDGLPSFLDELDNPVGVGGVGVVALVPHGSGRWCSILPYVLIKVSTVWVVLWIKSLSYRFSFVVSLLLRDTVT